MTHSTVGSLGAKKTRSREALSQQRLASRKAPTGLQTFVSGRSAPGKVRGDGTQNRPVEAIPGVSTFCAIARQKSVIDDVEMNSKTKRPRVGDQVGIAGFLGRFEVVQVALDGAMTDLKHLDVSGPDYIERDILSQELIYLNARKADSSAKLPSEVLLTR